MEQAILAMLGIIITLAFYLDRGRRADIALLRSDMETGFKEARAHSAMLRQDMNDGNAQIREEMRDGNAQIREEMRDGNAQIREEMRDGNAQIRRELNDGLKQVHNRLDKLTDVVMDLCRRVGRLEGRAEASNPKPDTSQ